jgi:CheY-like chemotaxis protein
VLIVEDNLETRQLVRRTLEREGWAVSEAGNGKEGLERVEEKIPALIVLDLMMPIMDGFEFVQRLRAVEAWQRVPVVVMTAKDLTDADRRELSGHVETVLEKGEVSREKLLEQVRDLVTTCTRRGAGGA